MDAGPISAVLQHIRRLAAADGVSHLPDGQLLKRFIAGQDEAAFAALLERHGPMVWRVCQRVLRHRQNAEDVFQATFLTLARKAASIQKQASVASWLHGVAYRIARRVQADLARQRLLDSPATSSADEAADALDGQELQAVLDEELTALTEKCRLPLVLCFLEGKTRDEAAAQLGWSLSTLKRRLDRGRKMLAGRLTRRGISLGVALFSALLTPETAWTAIPPTILGPTCEAACLVAAGKTATAVVSGQVALLTEGMVKAIMMKKVKVAAAVVLAMAALIGGAGLWTAHRMQAGEPAGPVIAAVSPATGDKAIEEKPPVEAAGKEPARSDLAALIKRGDYLVNNVARCGDCHTPRTAKGAPDLSRHLQGATLWFAPKGKPRGDWEDEAPDITSSGRAGKWPAEKMIKFLSTGEKSEPPMPAYHLTLEDAQAVTLYLRSLGGRKDVARRGDDD